MDSYRNHIILRKEFVKVVPSYQFYFNLFINDIFNNCNEYGISIDDKRCCGGLFADDIVLCAPTRSQLKKIVKVCQ